MKKPLGFIKKIVDAVVEEINLPEKAIIQELNVKLTKEELPVIDLKIAIKGE